MRNNIVLLLLSDCRTWETILFYCSCATVVHEKQDIDNSSSDSFSTSCGMICWWAEKFRCRPRLMKQVSEDSLRMIAYTLPKNMWMPDFSCPCGSLCQGAISTRTCDMYEQHDSASFCSFYICCSLCQSCVPLTSCGLSVRFF